MDFHTFTRYIDALQDPREVTAALRQARLIVGVRELRCSLSISVHCRPIREGSDWCACSSASRALRHCEVWAKVKVEEVEVKSLTGVAAVEPAPALLSYAKQRAIAKSVLQHT